MDYIIHRNTRNIIFSRGSMDCFTNLFRCFYVSDHCTCTSFVNKNGYGNCMKEFNGKGPLCYVKEPSTCTDLEGSTIADGRNYSWNACSNQGYHFNIFISISKEYFYYHFSRFSFL